MATLDSIAPEAREGTARIGDADLVVALPSCHDRESLDAAVAKFGPVLSTLLAHRKAVLLYPDTAIAAANGAAPSGGPELELLPYPLPPVERFREQTLDQGLRSLMLVGRALGARACVMLGSETAPTSPDDLRTLAEPVLNQGYDLAVPLYARRKLVGLINSGIVYPIARALYGARLNYPLAADLVFSGELAERELNAYNAKDAPSGWLTTRAVCAGLQVCQVHHEAPPLAAGTPSPDVAAVLAEILGRLFLDIERTAGFWQRVRGSQPIRAFGRPRPAETESPVVDVHPMVETFQLGCRDLLDIWAPVISPATLAELRRIAKFPAERFALGDELWARVLYDFILGYRQRVISREHLLRALTPIYLGWIASYAQELRNAAPDAIEQRIESLCMTFEKLKPYLVSRWRWPDRFNP